MPIYLMLDGAFLWSKLMHKAYMIISANNESRKHYNCPGALEPASAGVVYPTLPLRWLSAQSCSIFIVTLHRSAHLSFLSMSDLTRSNSITRHSHPHHQPQERKGAEFEFRLVLLVSAFL